MGVFVEVSDAILEAARKVDPRRARLAWRYDPLLPAEQRWSLEVEREPFPPPAEVLFVAPSGVEALEEASIAYDLPRRAL